MKIQRGEDPDVVDLSSGEEHVRDAAAPEQEVFFEPEVASSLDEWEPQLFRDIADQTGEIRIVPDEEKEPPGLRELVDTLQKRLEATLGTWDQNHPNWPPMR